MNELVSEKDLEKLKDYDRLKREYTLLHEDYRRLLGRYKKQLAIQGVVKSFYCFEESMNMQLKCDSQCDYCKSIKIEQ